ncbi:hypothetical protein JMUB6875_34280 [Nocardia sp. JMUB6875]|uniref:WXG100-like domain-containing protein n=1 Tax=Nocardia sp. JMUB6875 TaxID=3158170 RepID=UPI0032E75964
MSGWTWVGDHLPGWLMTALNFGAAYPKGDQDALFDLGDAWKKAAADLEKLEPDLKSVTGKLPQYYDSAGAAKVSAELATLFDGKEHSIQQLVESLNQLGHDARATGTEIEYTKIQSEIFAVLTLYTVLQLSVTLFGEALVPGVLATARASLSVFCKKAMERIGLIRARAAMQTIAKPLIREITVPLGEKIAAPLAEKVVAPLAEKIAQKPLLKTSLEYGAKSVVSGLGAGAMGAGLDAGTQLIQIMEGHRDDGFDLKQTFQTSLQWGVGGAVGAPFHTKLGNVLKETRLPSKLGGAIAGGVGGLAGAGGMYGTGLATQLYDNGGDWSKVDKTFHTQLLIGGLAMGAGGGANHGLQGGHGAPSDIAAGTKSIPDGSASHSPAPEVKITGEQPNHVVQQEVHTAAQTVQPVNHPAADAPAGRAAPITETPRGDLKTSAPTTGDGAGRTSEVGAKPGETAPKPTESAAPRGNTPTQPGGESPARLAPVATEHRGNVVSGTQERGAPVGRAPEGRSVEVTSETQTRSTPVESTSRPEQTSPAHPEERTDPAAKSPAPEESRVDPANEKPRLDDSAPQTPRTEEPPKEPAHPQEPKERLPEDLRSSEEHPEGQHRNESPAAADTHSTSDSPTQSETPPAFVMTPTAVEPGSHPSAGEPRGGTPRRPAEGAPPRTPEEAKPHTPGKPDSQDGAKPSADEPSKAQAAHDAQTPVADASKPAPAEGDWSPRPEDKWSKLDSQQVADELAARHGLEVEGFDHSNLDPEVVREFARGIDDMLERYPDVDLRKVTIEPLEPGVYAETFDEKGPSGRRYTDKIALNRDYALDPEWLARDIAADEAAGHLVPGSADRPIHSTLVHEFGHVLAIEGQEHAEVTAYKALRDYFESTRGGMDKKAFQDFLDQLSGYSFDEHGRLNGPEAVAEAFTEVEYHGEGASEPAKVLYHHLLESARDHGSKADGFEHLPDDVIHDPRPRKGMSPDSFEPGGEPRENPADAPAPEPSTHGESPTSGVEHYLDEPHISAALDRADELGVTTKHDGVETPVSTVIRDLLPQHPEIAEMLRNNEYLEHSLLERPKTLASLLTHPDGLPLLHDAVEAVQNRGPESVLTEPVHVEPTPITPEQRAISQQIREATSDVPDTGRRQPEFDYSRLDDPDYRREFLQKQYDIWRPTQDALNDIVRDIAKDTEGKPGWREQPKDETRAWDKIKKYDGDVSQLTDLVGAKIEFDHISDAYRALEMIENDPRIRIVEFEDRFEQPKASGYRDLQMKVQLDNGHIAELRLHLSHIDAVAEYEHGLFEVQRDLDALAKDEHRTMTPKEEALSTELKRLVNERFWEATQKGLEEPSPKNEERPDETRSRPRRAQPDEPHPERNDGPGRDEHQPSEETPSDHHPEPSQPDPVPLTPHEIESQWGIPEENQRKIQAYADEHNLIIEVRPTNVDAVPHLQRGDMPKPMSIKDKTIGEDDVALGAPPEAKGLVGRFRPDQLTLPEEGTVSPADYARLKARYEQRVKDYAAYQKHMQDLIDQQTFRVTENGVVEGKFNGEWKPVTGDHDLFDIRHADGSRLTPEEERTHRQELIELDAGIQHGPHVYWEPANEYQRVRNFEDIVNKHQYDADPAVRAAREQLVRFQPEEQPELTWAAKDLDGVDRELTPWHIEDELASVQQQRLYSAEEQSRTHFSENPDATPAERAHFEDELRRSIDEDISDVRERVIDLANHSEFDHADYRAWLDDTFRTPIDVEIGGERQSMMFIDRGEGIEPVLARFDTPAHELAELRQELRNEVRPDLEVRAPELHPDGIPVVHSLEEARELGTRLRDENAAARNQGPEERPSVFPHSSDSPSHEPAGMHPSESDAAESVPVQSHSAEVDWAPRLDDEWSQMHAREISDELHRRWGIETEGFENPDVHPEVVREYARAIDDMMSRFPDAKLPKVTIERLPDDYNAALAWDRAPDGRVYTEALILNETVARAPEEMARESVELEADRHFTPGSSDRPIYSALVHEFGHILDVEGQLNAAKTAMDALDNHYQSTRGGMDKAAYEQWLDQLSGYSFDEGRLDPHEALAEAFTEVETNGEAASEPAKVLYRHLLDNADAHNLAPNGFRIPDDIIDRPTGPHEPEQHTPKPEDHLSGPKPDEPAATPHEPSEVQPASHDEPHVNPDRPSTLTQHLKDRFEQLRQRINDIFAAHQDPARAAELPKLRAGFGDLVDRLGLRDQNDWVTPWKLFREHDGALAQYVEQNHEHLLPSLKDLSEANNEPKVEPAAHEPVGQHDPEPKAEHPKDEQPKDEPHPDDPDILSHDEIPDREQALTPDEQEAVHRYTDPDADVFSDLNHRLRNGLELEPEQQKLVADITSGLEKLPAYDGTVWRGTHLTPEQIARYVPGEKVTEASFTSTSRDPRRIFTSKVEFIIHSESGRDISALSARPSEKEVLFKPGTTFEVRGVVEDPNAGLFGVTRIYLYESAEHTPVHEAPVDRTGHEVQPNEHTATPDGDVHAPQELPVRHGPDRTALGDSPEVQRVYDNVRNEGEHDVVVHGDRFGKPTAEGGFEIDPQQVVEAIRNNPNYVEGTPIRLLSCHSGNELGWAQHIANELGVPVRAPSDLVGVRAVPDSPAVLHDTAEWRTFHPTEPDGTTPKPTAHKPTDHPEGRPPKYEEDPRENWDILGQKKPGDESVRPADHPAEYAPAAIDSAEAGSPQERSPDHSSWQRPTDDWQPLQRGGELEQQVRDGLKGTQVKPGDVDSVLANLANHPAGREIAEAIASRRFEDVPNYSVVASSLVRPNLFPGALEQLRLASRLLDSGFTDIAFEIKQDGHEIRPGVFTDKDTDLDVMARDSNGDVHGWQFKNVASANPSKVIGKVFSEMPQLIDSHADYQTFVLDTVVSMSDLTPHLSRLENNYSDKGVQVIIRTPDGIVFIPPGGTFMPEGAP